MAILRIFSPKWALFSQNILIFEDILWISGIYCRPMYVKNILFLTKFSRNGGIFMQSHTNLRPFRPQILRFARFRANILDSTINLGQQGLNLSPQPGCEMNFIIS